MKKAIYSILAASMLAACSYSNNFEINDTAEIPSSRKTLAATPVVSLSASEASKVIGFAKSGDEIVIGHFNADHKAVAINLKSQARQNLFQTTNRTEKAGTCSFEVNGSKPARTFNYRTGQLTEASALSTRSGESATATIQLPKGQKHLQVARAGKFIIATGLYAQGRYLLYTPETGEADYQGSYPEHPVYPDIQESTKSILYASTVLKVSPDQQSFVCADKYSGYIEFCRISGDRINQGKSYCFHYPRVAINENARCKVGYYRTNQFGFTDITVSDDRVFAIYSGQTNREAKNAAQQCKKMMVFDWDGNLLETYDLATSLTKISYDEAEDAIYGLGHTPDPAVVKISL